MRSINGYELFRKYLFLAKKRLFFNNPYQLIFPIPVKGEHKTNDYYGNGNGGVYNPGMNKKKCKSNISVD